jgi:hypothetical protein
MVALALFVAPWAYAGNLSVLSDAQDKRQAVRSFIPPGAIVKAEFKSNHSPETDMTTESDQLLPEPGGAETPAVRERSAQQSNGKESAMAPPPVTRPDLTVNEGPATQMRAATDDYENELAKDLVLPPPPPKIEQTQDQDLETLAKPSNRGVEVRPAKRPRKNGLASPKRPPSTSNVIQQASRSDVRKVRPVTRNNWATPAGSHYRPQRFTNNPPRADLSHVSQHGNRPEESQRFVRDGVTIKLAPTTAQAGYAPGPERSAPEEIAAAASEIIGLPFAFISSFF